METSLPVTTNDNQGISVYGINNPDIDPKSLKPGARAIKDAQQAALIVKQLIEENRTRQIKNSRIMEKYNAADPYNKADLEADGLGWKHNFSTKPLGILIDKIAPRFVKAVQSVRYLTSSALPEEIPGSSQKTEVFRAEVTKTIRNQRGWKNFVTELSQENALFGFTVAANTDEYSWMPRHYRQDEFFVPRGTKQNSEHAQLIVLKDTFLLHELFSLIADKSAAESAGWNVENTINAINNAMPDTIKSRFTEYLRVYEDLQRELNVGVAHYSGAKSVMCYHIFSTEISGKVSHRIMGGELGELSELFTRDDQFESMEQVISFFAFQYGNGTLHGSKGIGREVYKIAAVLDRARNEVVDRLQLSGKVIIKCDPKNIKRFRMSVVGNSVLIGNDYELQTQKIEANVEPFFQLDNFLVSLLDEIAGTVSPKVLEGDRVTKAAVDLVAGREEERRDVIIDRFMAQMADLVSTMQNRLCNPNTTEPEAKQLQEKLLKFMSREELDMLANQPAANTIQDFTEQQRQQIVLLASEEKGNPIFNQKNLQREKLNAIFGPGFADRVLLPDNDPTEEAEQSREQLMENSLMIAGRPVPVSPRDNHRIHLDNLYPVIEATVKAMINDPEAITVLKNMVQHGDAHVQMGINTGEDKAAFAEDARKFKNYAATITQIEQHIASAPPELLAASSIPEDHVAHPMGRPDGAQLPPQAPQAAMPAAPMQ